MAIISFAHTTDSLLKGQKTVTRRNWSSRQMAMWQRQWDKGFHIHDAYDKSPRCHGKKVGRIKLTARPYWEKLKDMPESDLPKEGYQLIKDCKYQWRTIPEFIGRHDPEEEWAVIRFEKMCDVRAEKWQCYICMQPKYITSGPDRCGEGPGVCDCGGGWKLRHTFRTDDTVSFAEFKKVGTSIVATVREGVIIDLYELHALVKYGNKQKKIRLAELTNLRPKIRQVVTPNRRW